MLFYKKFRTRAFVKLPLSRTVHPGGSVREMRAAVTVFRGIARNCIITLRFSPVSADLAGSRGIPRDVN